MKLVVATSVVWLGASFSLGLATADEPSQATATPVQLPDDRLMFTANGSTLSQASGGGGAGVRWLHNVSAGALISAGAEYQTIADSHWTYGSLTGALTRGGGSSPRWSLYGEIHQGAGSTAGDSFTYSVAVAGIDHSLTNALSLQVEDRHIDIDRTHGNLPKLGISYLWNPRLLTSVSYANSVSGNLGTELVSGRIDYYGQGFNALAGGAFGDAAPAVVNLQTGLLLPEPSLKQVFVGFAKPFSRVELMAVADYLDLDGTERWTLTVSCTVHLRARTEPR